jgi:hypothetical protein
MERRCEQYQKFQSHCDHDGKTTLDLDKSTGWKAECKLNTCAQLLSPYWNPEEVGDT